MIEIILFEAGKEYHNYQYEEHLWNIREIKHFNICLS